MEIGKATSVYQTQEVKGTKETYYKEAQKVDYSKYSADDLMQIPFEEAKVNQESIDKRVKELSDDGKINDKKFGKFIDLKRALNFSGNSSIDKAYYETIQSIQPPEKTGLLSFEFQMNFQGFAQGEDISPTFMKDGRSGNGSYLLNKNQATSVDFDAFINSAIASFEKNLTKAKSSNAENSVQNQYQGIVDFYKTFQDNFNKATKEPYYA
ncbi:hypothetical protein [Aliarcobacter cryaerophilus]|jgi:hypothetical protein|uniref:hypothetical protein n=1 Tax=Aliarcobacter cryaerophilus TaxID=28198 RepID=UPI0021B34EB1|nr:hypothetical protein [Aliarcobacter cryaerophilus]MCT7432230.1 hypothetical protein [Aliarcobacter cryaerophilus]MCT7527065.1 hypothetical protein [Aliarcobacter cryaerophilus]